MPANEQSARAAIATERVEDLSADAQKAYGKLERVALRAALATKKKLLKQAESGRPTAASPERDLLDARLSEMRAEIATGDQKLAVLDAQPQ
ncbi:MAG TPA: hypothetical protein VJV78_08065 [Polyangiales bacterium]|nr:hypothetical protein [Polyangiales bacterium]